MDVKDKLTREIVSSIAQAIRNHDSFGEIKDMFVDTVSFKEAIDEWRDPDTGLNLLELAVVCDFLEAAKFLTSFCFWRFNTYSAARPVIINGLFHLACYVGSANIAKYFLQQEGDSEESYLLGTPGIVTYPNKFDKECINKKSLQLPFEICIEQGHVECAITVFEFIVKKHLHRDIDLNVLEPLTHQACVMGAARFLELLIQNGHSVMQTSRTVSKSPRNCLPMHVAAMNGEAECLEVLLRHGAHVNATTECRSALHILYFWKAKPHTLAACSQVLVDYGINVIAMDHNHNTPLDYLAWEISQKPYHAYDDERRKKVKSSKIYCYTKMEETENTNVMGLHDYKCELLKTMKVLLDAGADTVVKDTNRLVEHTVIHTLLQNTGWPLSSCLFTTPMDVYAVLELLFQYDCDPNLLAKHNMTSSFTTLILHSLHEVQNLKHKCQFVHLFIQNGADLEQTVPPPMYFRQHPTDRVWSVYPVLLALQETHPMTILDLVFSFMSQTHVNAAITSPHLRTCMMYMSTGKDAYKENWRLLRHILVSRPRALRHLCKVTIFKSVGRKVQALSLLPLPTKLINYISSMEI